VVRKQASAWKQNNAGLIRFVAATVAVMSWILTGCAPISPNVKYLFAPEVRTCASTSSIWRCSARVNRPSPKTVYQSFCTRGEKCAGFEKCNQNGMHDKCDGSGQQEACINGTHEKCGITTVTVTQAANYATQVEEEYIGAKGEYGSISSAFGLVLIPAGASALALGGFGESATAVSALGFGSAAILGTGYWLSNQPREKAYMAGAGALECLKGTMQPFDVEQGALTLVQLCYFDSKLSDNKDALQMEVNNYARALSDSKTQGGSAPDGATKKKLCDGEKLLKAGNASLKAATSAYDSSTKYYNYSYDNAGYEMVGSVDAINDQVSSSMITSEPDLSGLGTKLSTVIPDSAQKLAGIDKNATASKTAVEKAATALNKAQAAAPKPGNGPGAPLLIDAKAADLYSAINRTNNAAEEVVIRTPTEIVPKAKECLKIFSQPGTPPDVLTLNPAGDIPLSPGDSSKVIISGGKLPYAVRWLCDCYNDGVTAQTTYQDSTATIVIAASDIARPDSYPLMITDATGIGSSLNVVVASKKVDNSDTPDCVEGSATPPSPGGRPANRATVNAVAQAADSAHSAAVQAATAASAAKSNADKAEEAATDGNKQDAATAAQRATRDAASAYSALARAQLYARQARARAGAYRDPVLTSLVQTADSEVGSAASSAAAAAADAARAQRAAS